ncbi:hypothetical protein GCM10011506_35730 [Marivirga lumbricoides]|uniref:Uncharacterized protein n=1 Tax=Marivirga lumbricoides TaxID=1046115 RepID=A0ABQ1MU64_9BACT|nr:hypothetical protein GCM10011506_35730 [Marivirga lumbricoides]
MSKEQKIHISLSLEDTKLIFKALGKMPFEEVYELIGNLNNQVNEQSSKPQKGDMMDY